MMDAVLVTNANRMMTAASLLEDGIELSFADGSRVSYLMLMFLRSKNVRRCPALSCQIRTRWCSRLTKASGSRFPGTLPVITVTHPIDRPSRR